MEVTLLKLFTLCLISSLHVTAQHRPPPGVNPQQYQQQQQQQYQGAQGVPPPQQYQGAPGVPPPQQYQGAPGVPPPQQYQPAPPPQQYQPAPPPQQYQPAPAQQFNQGAQAGVQAPQQGGQQFQQQVPPAQPHAHQPHGGAPKVLHNNNINDERAHIKDHMEVPLDTSGMSEQELQFHYFKMHDADNNNRLDGQELIKSLFHWHDESNHDAADKQGAHQPPSGEKIFTDEELVNMIDPILLQDDHNSDGYIDYSEFMAAQKKTGTTANN